MFRFSPSQRQEEKVARLDKPSRFWILFISQFRFHVECIKLKVDDIKEDVDFYCPTCIPEKEEQFQKIKQKLKIKVDELATRQNEFGGVTIDRDMFKEKKNANPHNYSKDFPPTLRDLGLRIISHHKTMADFKIDYKEMCKQLTENLKDDFESRIQMVEWELDDIIEEVVKDDDSDHEENANNTPEESVDNVGDLDEDDTEAVVETDPDTSEDVTESLLNHGGLCDNCMTRFSSPIIYNCMRSHRVCYPCRNLINGCICPVCYKQYGDRKRLFQDNTSSMMYRLANASNYDSSKLNLKSLHSKRRVKNSKKSAAGSPMIMNVWSCSEGDTNNIVLDADVTVKKEPEEENDNMVSMSSVIPATELSSNMLTLIDPNVVASPEHSSDQEPINYNDTDSEEVRMKHEDTNQTPEKKRRISGEDWMQSLNQSVSQTFTSNIDKDVWARYKEKAKHTSKTPVKYVLKRPQTHKTQPHQTSSIQVPGTSHGLSKTKMNQILVSAEQIVNAQKLQKSQTHNLAASHSGNYFQPSQTKRHVIIKKVHQINNPPQSSQPRPPPPLKLMPSKQIIPVRRIVIRNPAASSSVSSLASSTSSSSSLPSSSLVTGPTAGFNFYNDHEPETDPIGDEDQFITPDMIQECSNEIEKYLEADDNNIFENIETQEDPSLQHPSSSGQTVRMTSYFNPKQ